MLLRFSYLLIFSLLSSGVYSQALTPKAVMTKMLTATETVKTARYHLKKQERIKNVYIDSEMKAKLQTNPYKVYVYNIKPTSGSEVLFMAGENNGDAIVNPNAFPYINLRLNPNNSTLRKDQHHTLNDLGFNYISTIIKNQIKRDGEKFYSFVTVEGEVDWSGKKMIKLNIENKTFGHMHYTVQAGENITSIAKKLNVSDYMILSLNPKANFYDDVKPGMVLKVPNSYAKRIILYVDKTTYLPLAQFIYDDKGLYEKYEMHNFILNPIIKSEEFSTSFKEYHF